jgi:predicted rRNA methylase YqxC with S4 and FtsJ domains
VSRGKTLAAAALWALLMWFISIAMDYRAGNKSPTRDGVHAALGMGVGIGYWFLRMQSRKQQVQRQIIDYFHLREDIRLIIADVLRAPDEELLRELQKASKRIEKVIVKYQPKLEVFPERFKLKAHG